MDVRSLQLAVLALGDLELDGLALIKGLVTVHLDLGEVNEQIVAVLAGDEAITLVGVEPLNSSLRHNVPFYLAKMATGALMRVDDAAIPRGLWYPMSRAFNT